MSDSTNFLQELVILVENLVLELDDRNDTTNVEPQVLKQIMRADRWTDDRNTINSKRTGDTMSRCKVPLQRITFCS